MPVVKKIVKAENSNLGYTTNEENVKLFPEGGL